MGTKGIAQMCKCEDCSGPLLTKTKRVPAGARCLAQGPGHRTRVSALITLSSPQLNTCGRLLFTLCAGDELPDLCCCNLHTVEQMASLAGQLLCSQTKQVWGRGQGLIHRDSKRGKDYIWPVHWTCFLI